MWQCGDGVFNVYLKAFRFNKGQESLSSNKALLETVVKHRFPLFRTRALAWDFTWMTSRTAPLPRAPPYRRNGRADSRKQTRGGRLELFTSLIRAFRSRTSGKAAARSAKPGHTDKPFPCSAAEVSHQFVHQSCSLWEMFEVCWLV